ncbi:DUF6138 family protein [Paenibacillus sp. GCM10027626]|uniref:DUF6138 family protein n=1 Tax=Paenibacillus sp. GCM10027626 TaxID=3273411 RepID=UPI00362A7654
MEQEALEVLIEELMAAFDRWFDDISQKDADNIVKRSPLQVGIHDYACVEYMNGRISLSTTGTDFLDSSNKKKARQQTDLTSQQVTEIIHPRLTAMLLERVEALKSTPILNYYITFNATLQVEDGVKSIELLHYVDEAKRNLLLERIDRYVQQKIMDGRHPTKPLDTFFLARHLLDKGLFSQPDYADIIAIYKQIIELNKAHPNTVEKHRMDLISTVRSWVEDEFLLQYFNPPARKWSNDPYTLKEDAALAGVDPAQLELLLYAATMIIKYEPSYSRHVGLQFLDCAIALGSKKAVQYTKEGSGAFAREDIWYKDEQLECKANDIFSTITVAFKQESEASYGLALDFICNLLEKGFQSSYQLKLKASQKTFLPIKGLAKSHTHRFFASAAEYAGLHPKLEQYAKLAMKEFEWYADTEGEKSCMPGSYAVFALALRDSAYFPLVEQYMALVDEEHQLVQDKFVEALIAEYGISPVTMPTLVICLLKCTERVSIKPAEAFETEENMQILLEQTSKLSEYEVDLLVYQIWRGSKKLKTRSKKAPAAAQPLLLQLLERCSDAV